MVFTRLAVALGGRALVVFKHFSSGFYSSGLCYVSSVEHPCLLSLVSGSHCHFLAMASVVSYSPPWWVNLLHRLPHFNLRFEQTSSDFQPDDWTYQQVKHLPELSASCKRTLFVIWVGPRLILSRLRSHVGSALHPPASFPSPFDPCHHLCRAVVKAHGLSVSGR